MHSAGDNCAWRVGKTLFDKIVIRIVDTPQVEKCEKLNLDGTIVGVLQSTTKIDGEPFFRVSRHRDRKGGGTGSLFRSF